MNYDEVITDLNNRRLALMREVRDIEDQLVTLRAEKRIAKLTNKA